MSRTAEPSTRSTRSRRELLAGAAGAVGVIAAESLAKVSPAQATQGEAVIAGEDNTETHFTSITNTSAVGSLAGSGFIATGGPGTPSESGGTGVKGSGGRLGGLGVFGQGGDDASPNGGGGDGVLGQAGDNASGSGVRGLGGRPDGRGVYGIGVGTGAGVFGTGGYSNGPGVLGSGGNPGGDGVQGKGLVTGTGVVGTGGDAGGNGVHGVAGSSEGVGVLAEGIDGGTSLQVIGTAVFSRSGKAAVRAGDSSVTVGGLSPLTRTTLAVATLQQHRGGVHVEAAVPNIAAGSIEIYLNQAVTKNTRVGWFLAN